MWLLGPATYNIISKTIMEKSLFIYLNLNGITHLFFVAIFFCKEWTLFTSSTVKSRNQGSDHRQNKVLIITK